MSLQALTEHRRNIPAFGIESAETLGPTNEFAVIDTLLPIQPQGVTYCGDAVQVWQGHDLQAWVRELEGRFTSR